MPIKQKRTRIAAAVPDDMIAKLTIAANTLQIDDTIKLKISGQFESKPDVPKVYNWKQTPTQHTIMKQQVIDYLLQHGATGTSYSGKSKTLYVKIAAGAFEILRDNVLSHFGPLPFTIAQ